MLSLRCRCVAAALRPWTLSCCSLQLERAERAIEAFLFSGTAKLIVSVPIASRNALSLSRPCLPCCVWQLQSAIAPWPLHLGPESAQSHFGRPQDLWTIEVLDEIELEDEAEAEAEAEAAPLEPTEAPPAVPEPSESSRAGAAAAAPLQYRGRGRAGGGGGGGGGGGRARGAGRGRRER